MEIGLKGNLLPSKEAEFADNYPNMKFKHCVSCNELFTKENTYTLAGWRETQISGFCEKCFDELFKDND
jgi:hypothetical protein